MRPTINDITKYKRRASTYIAEVCDETVQNITNSLKMGGIFTKSFSEIGPKLDSQISKRMELQSFLVLH